MEVVKFDSSKLQTVTANDPKFSDIQYLKDEMLKSIVVLEHSLFSQASFEYERLHKIRDMIKVIETDLLSPEVYSQLSPKEKMTVYQTLLRNMDSSLQFLNTLHRNVSSGLEVVAQVDLMQRDIPQAPRKVVQVSESTTDMRKLLLDKLKSKLSLGHAREAVDV